MDKPLVLTHLGTDPASGEDGSPRAFATNRGTFVIQGLKITDPTALAELRRRGMPDHEDAVEIPASILQFLPTGDA